jgi:hypothetical protein
MAASDYNSLIPQATDQPSTSQNQLLLNFGAIMDLIDVDHVDFAAANAGKHKQVTFPVLGIQPTFVGGDVGLFSFLSTVTANNELNFTNFNGITRPITASLLSTDDTPNNDVPGWFYLPCGMLVKFGSSVATGSTTVPFPVAGNIPVFAQVMWAAAMPRATGITDPNTMVSISSFSATGVTVYGSSRTTAVPAAASFEYIAIGY